jgi:hypothetical protein
MNATACTLFEGDYHLGAAALINSLVAADFTGTVICGYKGALPSWAEHAHRLPHITVKFVVLTTPQHLTNHKAVFMNACWDEHAPETDQLYYFDPDIVVKAPWNVLARWAKDGVALCEDINANLLARHPYRLAWLDFLAAHGLSARRTLERYHNAGFIGLPRALRAFIQDWQRVLDLAAHELGPLNRLKNGQPHRLFHSMDQDALNLALLLSDIPINASGPEGMEFTSSGHLLSHAAGRLKPWRAGLVRQALAGCAPSRAQKAFYDFADGPLVIFTPGVRRRRHWALRLGSLITRFYRRT